MQELGREAAALSTQMHAEKEQKRKEGGEGGREGGGEVGTERRENSEAERQKDGGGQGLKGEPSSGKLPSSVQVPCPHLPTPTRAKQQARGLEDQSRGAEGAGRGMGAALPGTCSPASGCPVPSFRSTWGSYRACDALGRRAMLYVGGGGLRG